VQSLPQTIIQIFFNNQKRSYVKLWYWQPEDAIPPQFTTAPVFVQISSEL
jgi:hypothetical protein